MSEQSMLWHPHIIALGIKGCVDSTGRGELYDATEVESDD